MRFLLRRVDLARRALAGGELVAAVRPQGVQHPLRSRLSAFVVGARVVVGAVRADVEVRSAALALVAEGDTPTGREQDFAAAAMAVHVTRLLEFVRRRKSVAVQSGRARTDRPCMAGQDRPRPIFSSLSEDPALQDGIDAFVVVLAERVDELQDCEARGDLPGLARLCDQLLLESAKVGFDSLSRCAAATKAAAEEQDAEAARKAIVELTEVAQRVRSGHRGSV